MLISETKRHIDAARQVLVGVVPNPAEQINQITNALIYKFMDDMDQSAIKAGGQPSFFTGELERYAWTRLMDTRIGNQERMNLYSESLLKFSEAKQLPELFRGIFKSAFLPYRSPEVLGLFLQEISYFDYTHSEELGNAYEYLLSIMSSQGDAGQFRTPRHIIDFIVAVVNPTKDDKVLDPACGTAGFLISAYKHIIEQHDGKSTDGSKNDEKPLTPDQRRALLSNFEGYDIDPSMVRISQVNMYLHQFKNPKIFSYNTLADEERWNDNFDVILANPPFMSPKGGVSTHHKFSIESSRSEVLFVDYIMNHLRPRGRAGVIVPEGIIFQSGKGHTQLRKNLIADGLWAVVSLPSGVFNPYAGVKTSVLLFDNELSKKSTEIIFVKITNDGFDLGATKRPINKNDLPQALEILKAWKKGEKIENSLAVYVEKAKIDEKNDYNLSGERYDAPKDYNNAKWPMVELGDLFEMVNGRAFKKEEWKDQGVPIIRIGNLNNPNEAFNYFDDEYDKSVEVNHGDLLFSWSGTRGTSFGPHIWHREKGVLNQHIFRFVSKSNRIDLKYAYFTIKKLVPEIEEQAHGAGGLVHITKSKLVQFKIPLPPLEVQQQIVEELDGYQKIISGARQIVENWKPRIEVEEGWEIHSLQDICRKITDGTHQTPKYTNEGVPFLRVTDITGSNDSKKFISLEEHRELISRCKPEKGDVLYSKNGTIGVAKLVDWDWEFSIFVSLALLKPNNDILSSRYLELFLNSDLALSQASARSKSGTVTNLHLVEIKQFQIPLPPLEIQKQIVDKINAERTLVEGNKALMEIYEQKTKEVLAQLWKE